MSPRLLVAEAIAVVCGAVIGLLVVNALHWLFADGDFVALTVSPGRIVLVLVTVAIYAVFYHHMAQTPAALASFFVGIGLPAVIVLFASDMVLATTTVLMLYTVFSLVSLLTYRFVLANSSTRRLAAEVAGGPETTPRDRP